MVIRMSSKEEEKKSYTKCYSLDLHLTKNKYLKTFCYSDNYGKDIKSRFKPHKVSNIKQIEDPLTNVYKDSTKKKIKVDT